MCVIWRILILVCPIYTAGIDLGKLTYVLYPGMMLGYIYTYKLVLKEAVDALQVEYRAVRIYVLLGYIRHLDGTDVRHPTSTHDGTFRWIICTLMVVEIGINH